MRLLINVNYEDETGKYWQESYFKNRIVNINENDLHNEIASILRDKDGITLSYKNKPQQNMYRDTEGGPKQIGYIYRGWGELYDDVTYKWVKVRFNCWVELNKVEHLDLIEIPE